MRKRFLTPKSLITCSIAVVFAVGLWLVTHFVGEPQVRKMAVDTLMQSRLNAVSAAADSPPSIPQYRFGTRTLAPFLVRTSYAMIYGKRIEQGGALYFWCFGHVSKIRDTSHE